MAILIDAEPVIKRLTSVCLTDDCFGLSIQMGINRAMEILGEAKIVDAVEVVHGRWLSLEEYGEKIGADVTKSEYPGAWVFCSECGQQMRNINGWLYCPNCGAKMDGERKDND